MEKTFDPTSVEQSLHKKWEENYFSPSGKGKNYCIMLPPPNVTGSLHMGHGFQHTLMDILIRYHRMKGDNTLWQPGFDHAGISTQMVVERQLSLEGKTKHDLGREDFVKRIWDWKEESGNTITSQMRRIGSSVDWSKNRFTLDPGMSDAVQHVFIQWFDEGLIYRGQKLVNWDPKLCTAVSDLEVLSEEEQGKIWHIKYPVVDTGEALIVATTRPETLFGDTAVAVAADDERYQHLIGHYVELPFTNRKIPIIADEYVDKEFGTGCVKITPAHDFNDYEVGKRHDLPMINILTREAQLNEHAPEAYQGLDRFDARKKVLKELEEAGQLVKTEPHTMKIPRGEKSGVVIEPFLTYQWFVNAKVLAEPALEVVREGKVKFIPENWDKTYYHWLENIEDWCISRQLWWGHRIPAWYDAEGNIYSAKDEAAVREKYKLSSDIVLTQDEDVLDTWFSSQLWPFSTLGWPEETPDLKTFFPTDVLITGFDIIFFWVARMIMASLKLTGEIPFKEIYITGLVRDEHGHKMSKSKGNVLDPIDLIDGIDLETLVKKRTSNIMQGSLQKQIEKNTRKEFPDGIASYGTDPLRFTYAALAGTARNINFDIHRLDGYRNFCNKLWNAARYVLMNIEDKPIKENTTTLADRWITGLLQETILTAHRHMEHYRFDLLAQCLYEFVWDQFCDWYLELSKPALQQEETAASTRYVLLHTLESIVKLLHPIIPFITESIWQQLKPYLNLNDDSIMIQSYPEANESLIDKDIQKEMEWLKAVIVSIRTIRSEMNISPAKPLEVFLTKGDEQDKTYLESNAIYLSKLSRCTSITFVDEAPLAATALLGDLEIHIPLAGNIDVKQELGRIEKETQKLQKDLDRTSAKLNNPKFVDKAPKEVVEKEKANLEEIKNALQKSEEQKLRLASLG